MVGGTCFSAQLCFGFREDVGDYCRIEYTLRRDVGKVCEFHGKY